MKRGLRYILLNGFSKATETDTLNNSTYVKFANNMEVIVPIHEASEAPFFMSKLPSKLRARIMQNSAEKFNDKKKLTKVTDLVTWLHRR